MQSSEKLSGLIAGLLPALSNSWIALEGIDASGKTTQVERISRILCRHAGSVIVLPEFSKSVLGQMVSGIVQTKRFYSLGDRAGTPLADALSLIADLSFSIEDNRQALGAKHKTILSDRGPLSILAYQAFPFFYDKHTNENEALHEVVKFGQEVLRPLGWPDLNLFLPVSLEEMQKRVQLRGEKPMDEAQLEFIVAKSTIFDKFCDIGIMHRLETEGLCKKEVSMEILLTMAEKYTPSQVDELFYE